MFVGSVSSAAAGAGQLTLPYVPDVGGNGNGIMPYTHVQILGATAIPIYFIRGGVALPTTTIDVNSPLVLAIPGGATAINVGGACSVRYGRVA